MQILEKRSSDSRRFDVDCSLLLNVGETITSVGTPTAAATPEVTGTAITFGSPTVNISPATYTDAYGNTRTVPTGQVVQVQISGGAIPSTTRTQDYTLRFPLVTSQNPTVEATVKLRVTDTPT